MRRVLRAQAAAHVGAVAFRRRHQSPDSWRHLGLAHERGRRAERPQRGGRRLVRGFVEIEIDVAARVHTSGIDQANVKAVEQQTPPRLAAARFDDGEPPQAVERIGPAGNEHGDRPGSAERGGSRVLAVAQLPRSPR